MSLCIATPVWGGPEAGSVSLGYHQAMLAIAKAPGVTVLDHAIFTNTDLVRARSRALKIALDGGFDHLLFWDADVYAAPEQLGACLRGMLASGHELVGAPYSKKTKRLDPVAHGIDTTIMNGACHPCTFVGMGFTLISRRMMQDVSAMCPVFRDRYNGEWHDVRATFMLEILGDTLLSEDFSFCAKAERVRGAEGYAWLYVGEGAELGHVGAAVYGGSEHPAR